MLRLLLDDRDQVFNSDSERPRFVESGLVRDNHASLKLSAFAFEPACVFMSEGEREGSWAEIEHQSTARKRGQWFSHLGIIRGDLRSNFSTRKKKVSELRSTDSATCSWASSRLGEYGKLDNSRPCGPS